jgi:hypothetical protein
LDGQVFENNSKLSFISYTLLSYPPFYGFVVYERSEDANRAMREMSNGYVKDCRVRTTVALPRFAGRLNNKYKFIYLLHYFS